MKILCKWILSIIVIAICISTAAKAFQHGNIIHELPMVSDGLSIPTYLGAGDATNILYSEAVTGAFSTTLGSSTVTVTHSLPAGLPSGQAPTVGSTCQVAGTCKVSFANTSAPVTIGGLVMDGSWTVVSVIDNTHFTITHTGIANATTSNIGNTTITYTDYTHDGKLRFLCNFSHLSYNDPIVHPGMANSTHLHLFFGNTTTDQNSTYASLRAAGDGTCDGGPLNRTAYWMPAMIDGSLSKVRIPAYVEWYYQDNRSDLVDFTSPGCSGGVGTLQDGRPMACPQRAIHKIERGQQAIFGFRPQQGNYPPSYGGYDLLASLWTCNDTAGNPITPTPAGHYRKLSDRTTPSNGLTGDPLCPASGTIVARTGTPSCWNGQHDSADHYSQFAFLGQDGYGNPICPASHPYLFIGFTFIVSWNYTGGISSVNNWYLSSDRFNGANYEAGYTFHWDMLWAWNDTIQMWFHEHIQGMYPSSTVGAPYINNSAGRHFVGGPYMRNTNNGGLGSDCTPLGLAGPCVLKARSSGIVDQLLPIP